jgi:predicted ATP-grasp superfamily ATP-dependent carboligase
LLQNLESKIRPVIIGSFGPPTLACIRSWGEQGYPVGMICIRSEREGHPNSKYLTDSTTLPSKHLYTDKGIKTIKQFLRKFRATGIICISESMACWLNDNRSELPEKVAVWLPPNDIINDLLSKEKQVEIARKVGFNVLPTYLIKNLQSTISIPREHFPLCLRPCNPGGIKPSFKVRLIDSSVELNCFIRSFQKIDQPIIAQPFLNLPNLVVHGARTLSGTTIGLQAFLVERKFEGVTLTIRPTIIDKELTNKCIAFTNHFKLTGNYHFEFLIDKITGSTYFLEINNRLGGTTAKVYACGYDEPMLALEAYGVGDSNRKRIMNVTVSSKQALLKYLFYSITGKLTLLDYPVEPTGVRIANTIYGLLRYKDDIFSFRDLRGSLSLYLTNIKQFYR